MNFKVETNRLMLRILSPKEAVLTLAFYEKNEEYLKTFEPENPETFLTLEYQEKLLSAEGKLLRNGSLVRYWLFEKDAPDKAIGTVCFHRIRSYPFGDCEIGYKLDPDFQHKGYALEALSRLIPLTAKDCNLHRIEAMVSPDNLPSLRLLDSLGFIKEGEKRDSAYVNRTWVDQDLYSILINHI